MDRRSKDIAKGNIYVCTCFSACQCAELLQEGYGCRHQACHGLISIVKTAQRDDHRKKVLLVFLSNELGGVFRILLVSKLTMHV